MLAAEAVGMPATAATAVAAALDVVCGSAWVGHNIDLDNPIGRACLGLGIGLGLGLGLGLRLGLRAGAGINAD